MIATLRVLRGRSTPKPAERLRRNSISMSGYAVSLDLHVHSRDAILPCMLTNPYHERTLGLQRNRSSRTLHIVDFENLAGGPDFSVQDAEAVRVAYERVVGVGPRDLVVM